MHLLPFISRFPHPPLYLFVRRKYEIRGFRALLGFSTQQSVSKATFGEKFEAPLCANQAQF